MLKLFLEISTWGLVPTGSGIDGGINYFCCPMYAAEFIHTIDCRQFRTIFQGSEINICFSLFILTVSQNNDATGMQLLWEMMESGTIVSLLKIGPFKSWKVDIVWHELLRMKFNFHLYEIGSEKCSITNILRSIINWQIWNFWAKTNRKNVFKSANITTSQKRKQFWAEVQRWPSLWGVNNFTGWHYWSVGRLFDNMSA